MDIITLLCLSGFCVALKRFSKFPMEYTPFFVISTIITLLYIFAYTHILKAGANTLLVAGGILLISSPSYLWRERKQLSKKYLTAGFVTSLTFLLIFLSIAHLSHLSNWDEFTQWGPHTKLIFFNNGFLKASDVAIHKGYPPAGALFQYLFFRLSGFSEGTAYVAQSLLLIAPLCILIHKIKWVAWKKAAAWYSFILIILLLLHVSIGTSASLYMDDPVGIYFGMIMVAYFASEKNISSILYLIPAVAAMSIFKQKLFPLILMASMVIFVDQIIANKKHVALKLLAIITLPVISLIMTHSWHDFLTKIRVIEEWKLNLTPEKLYNAFFNSKVSVSHSIITNYCHALVPVSLFILVILFLNTITYFSYQSRSERVTFITANTILFAGFIAYIFGLLLLYLFSFTPYEALNHASMSRYLTIYYIGWSLVTVYFLIDSTRRFKNSLAAVFFLVVLLAALFIPIAKHLLHPRDTIWKLRQPIIKIADAVKSKTKPTDKIFTIWQNSEGLERAMMLYELTPRIPNVACTSFGKPYNKSDVWTCDSKPNAVLKQFGQFNYLLLAYTDKNFWSHYQSILPKRNTIKPLITYSICVSTGFDAFQKPGCKMETHHAYLLKISSKNGHIKFINVASEK